MDSLVQRTIGALLNLPPRDTSVERIKYIDHGWTNGVTCHHSRCCKVKDSTAMTILTVEKDAIIANSGALSVHRLLSSDELLLCSFFD